MTKGRAYPEYKATGLKWLGQVPASWDVVPLWTLYSRGKSTNFPDEELLSVYRDHGVVPKSSRGDNFNKPSDDLSSYQLVKPGDMVINKMKAWQGSVAISRHRGIVSPAYFVYEGHHGMDDRYLHYLLRSERYITGYLSLSKGIRINQWDLDPIYHSRMPVLVPSLQEQRAIVNLLDRETAQIGELIDKQERLIELLAEKRQAVITHAVTKGLDPTAPTKPSGLHWLGDVPVHWQLSRLKNVARIRYGLGQPPREAEDGIPVIRATNVRSGSVSRENLMLADPEDVPEGRDAYLRLGEIIVVRSGANTADSTIVREEYVGCLAGYDMVVRPIASNPEFTAWALLSDYIRTNQLVLASSRAAQPHLNVAELGEATVVLPPQDEQSTVASYLKEQTKEIDDLVSRSNAVVALLRERRSALISAAVTGKIDVRKEAS